jgi:hypothetical protein
MSIVEPWHVFHARIRTALVVDSASQLSGSLLESGKLYDAIFLEILQHDGLRYDLSPRIFSLLDNTYGMPAGSGRILIRTRHGLKTLFDPIHESHRSRAHRVFSEEWSNESWMSLTIGQPPPTNLDLDLFQSPSHQSFPGEFVAEWFSEPDKLTVANEFRNYPQTDLSRLWKQVIREPVIPYDIEERRRKLAHAYQVLAPHLKKLESDAKVLADAERRARARYGRRKKR